MAVKDVNLSPTAHAAKACVTMPVGSTATGQTALEVGSVVPGYNFEVVRVEAYCTDMTATATVNVLIETASCMTGAITMVDATPVAGTLATSVASRRGSATDALNLVYTTDGSGEIVKGVVQVWIRPFPMNGEAMPASGL